MGECSFHSAFYILDMPLILSFPVLKAKHTKQNNTNKTGTPNKNKNARLVRKENTKI